MQRIPGLQRHIAKENQKREKKRSCMHLQEWALPRYQFWSFAYTCAFNNTTCYFLPSSKTSYYHQSRNLRVIHFTRVNPRLITNHWNRDYPSPTNARFLLLFLHSRCCDSRFPIQTTWMSAHSTGTGTTRHGYLEANAACFNNCASWIANNVWEERVIWSRCAMRWDMELASGV